MVDNPYKYPYVPIGGIIEWDGTGLTGAPDLSTPEKVAAVYGYSTWERYGTDRVTVGAGGEYEAGATGGEKEHQLVSEELPSPIQTVSNIMYDASTISGGFGSPIQTVPKGTYIAMVGKIMIANANQPHNNMQPYIAPYRYRRIA